MLAAPTPFSLILFGASGHLAKLKLYPSLYVLALKKRLPKDFAIVGYARTEMSREEFRALVEASIRGDMPAVTEAVLEEFLTHVHYQQGSYDDAKDFAALASTLDALEKKWKDPVRIAYFSVPPAVFPKLSDGLHKGGVHTKETPVRCIVEKPVGSDLKSFENVREQLLSAFDEEHIYLLDHYLGKEAVRNVYYLRYANPLLERLFKNTLIDHVEIMAAETSGLEGRAGYFEHTGTFRDMMQSHLLMMASLLTMRLTDSDETMRESRLDALRQFYLPPSSNLSDIVLQGQYTAGKTAAGHVVGYREEPEVGPESRTNTFTAFTVQSRISRWQGIPFYLRSGKRMPKKETRISIQFQEPRAVGKGSTPNRLDIILQGEAGMRLHLQTRLGGTEPAYRPLVMEDPLVCMGDCLPEHGQLLLETIHGKKQWFLSFDEVRTAWRLVDPVQTYLDHPSTPLHPYPAGTSGPQEMHPWIAKDGRAWFDV